MRVIGTQLGPTNLHDLCNLNSQAIFDRNDYGAAQNLGESLRSAQSNGVHYPSVRAKGECFSVMRPMVLSNVHHRHYLWYHFKDGKIVEVTSIENRGR